MRASHLSKSMPMDEISLLLMPSVTETESQESYCASALTAQNCGEEPPMCAPKGSAAWNAGGICSTCAVSP